LLLSVLPLTLLLSEPSLVDDEEVKDDDVFDEDAFSLLG
jgi:hypothetical protein